MSTPAESTDGRSELVQRYFELESAIKKNEGCRQRLASQHQVYHEVQRRQHDCEATVEELRDRVKKEHRDVEKLQGLTVRSVILKARKRYEERRAKEEREFFEAYERTHRAEVECEAIKRRCQEEKEKLERLKAEVKIYEQWNAEQRSIETQLFAGPTPEFPTEDALEGKERALVLETDRLKHEVWNHRQAQRLTWRAVQEYSEAVSQLEQAKRLATADLFLDSFVVDLIKRSGLTDAKESAMRAQESIRHAQQLLPHLPVPNNSEIDGGNWIVDLVFDNIFYDYLIRERIIQALNAMTAAAQQTVRTAEWAARATSSVERDLERIDEEHEKTLQMLLRERKRILRSMINLPEDATPIIEPAETLPATETENAYTSGVDDDLVIGNTSREVPDEAPPPYQEAATYPT